MEVTGAVFTSDGEPAKGILVEWFSREMFLMGTRTQEIEGNTFRLEAPRSESELNPP